MKPICILGNGGCAREVFTLIRQAGGYKVCAFVDRTSGEPVQFTHETIPVLSEEDFRLRYPEGSTELAMGVADPSLMAKLAHAFANYSFPNIFHPSAIVDRDDNFFGRGNLITAGVIFEIGIRAGNFNFFNMAATIGHDTVIGDFNVINPGSNISGGVQLGNRNLIGVGSAVLQYLSIGNDCIVGAAALVTKNIPDGRKVIGVPARPVISSSN